MKWAQLYGSLNILQHFPSLGLEWKLTFSSPVAIDEFSKFAAYWVITFTASSSRIWYNFAGIPLPQLALFIVMLRKAHLTSHSRIADSRWVTTSSWLSRSLRPFLYGFLCVVLPLPFFFLGMVLVTVSCTVLQTSVHSSSGPLSSRSSSLNLSLPLCNHKGFDLGHSGMEQWFSFNLSLNFAIRSSWSKPQ